MSRNFCDIVREKYYTGAELGRLLEVRLKKEGIEPKTYHKGEMVNLLRKAGVQSVDGKWFGLLAIPVMKAEFERVKKNPKKKKAKPVGTQTPLAVTKESTTTTILSQQEPKQITIDDVINSTQVLEESAKALYKAICDCCETLNEIKEKLGGYYYG